MISPLISTFATWQRSKISTPLSPRKDLHMIGSDSTFRDAWLEGAARAFFVTAYADWIEEANSTDNDLTHDERMARLDLPRARSGQDWMDVAPTTPPNAYALAGELWNKLECKNKCSMYTLAERAALADGTCEEDRTVTKREVDANTFGHYLAMQAMGHGVSWFDDHARFEIVIPHIECSQCSFSDEAYAGE